MQLPNPETLLSDITTKITALIKPDTAIVGIHSGGVWLMERILASLEQAVPHGTLDAALYRDDFAQRGLKNQSQAANIAFDVQGKHIILIDDIFYTGRTTRAAINELFDFGRPASITLAVLINRGGAELPIQPQIVGATIPLTSNQRFQLSQTTQGKLNLALEITEDADV
ncbi:MAG: bifunctional pyr operon transcriptional regulator/uracil phosphoribosyltransferase PyrR [Betaproteobacteria bacterium]|jgi:pyrimidine operon attenuation protein / uracil phosphoribosyltransferase|nr:bifunctional pyr operon transcriptional regulator/uracil phosphoribosyltransferase PyrR [Betaproteobacteria bacterium]MCH9849304.1 bifunctional pyr operon transcriptional regulator/uracil phosphoribosyltransferase PyrR [Betaproteobacteria bacterium]MDG1097107.1 bifunctional pyr operon transcriptional regulator/uracil phosphoribosyltransferase PyrR [Methylophilaceae bacterium]MDG1452862.1 bifunctional pyr operon transcriptional regulator/uracil phosphoribosyltransferase PyrR [Methylophilaceae 